MLHNACGVLLAQPFNTCRPVALPFIDLLLPFLDLPLPFLDFPYLCRQLLLARPPAQPKRCRVGRLDSVDHLFSRPARSKAACLSLWSHPAYWPQVVKYAMKSGERAVRRMKLSKDRKQVPAPS